MAKVVLQGKAVLMRSDAAEENLHAATVIGKSGWMEVRASERLHPGKHFVVFASVCGDLLRTSCGTLERDGSKVFIRNTAGGHTYEFELRGEVA